MCYTSDMVTILIIDDETEICDILQDVFEQEKDFRILKANNGQDGVRLAIEERPDVILLDVKLQVDMDGVAVLKAVKKNKIDSRMIMITGFVDEVMEREIRSLGIDAYIEKPFTPPQIVETVKSVIQKKRSEESG